MEGRGFLHCRGFNLIFVPLHLFGSHYFNIGEHRHVRNVPEPLTGCPPPDVPETGKNVTDPEGSSGGFAHDAQKNQRQLPRALLFFFIYLHPPTPPEPHHSEALPSVTSRERANRQVRCNYRQLLFF